ncbi:hypothetical protein KCP69_10670 [Salmonella enterica subsp. enterica]|nr:hypothetical protein KCP69_10670 [Salmonella enterica subsp. enterica]
MVNPGTFDPEMTDFTTPASLSLCRYRSSWRCAAEFQAGCRATAQHIADGAPCWTTSVEFTTPQPREYIRPYPREVLTQRLR